MLNLQASDGPNQPTDLSMENVTLIGTRVIGETPARAPLASAQRPPRNSYDDKQAGAVLTTCGACRRAFYMTAPQAQCVACREGR